MNLIFDYDLDGSGSYIVLYKKFGDQITNYKTQGRSKHSINLRKLAMENNKSDTLISSDICWDEADVRFMSNNWKHVLIIDHHPESKNYIDMFKNVKMIFDESICSTMICYQTFLKNENVSNDLKKFVAIVNDYDTWKEDGKFFETGFYLNLLFFKYGFWDYVPHFMDGFVNFTPDQTEFIEEHKKNAVKSIEEMTTESFNNEEICLAFVEDCNFLNDCSIALRQWGHKLVFMIYVSHTNKVRVSIRSSNSDEYDIEEISKLFEIHAENNNIELISAGGHKCAGGIEFKNSLEIIETYEILKGFIHEQY